MSWLKRRTREAARALDRSQANAALCGMPLTAWMAGRPDERLCSRPVGHDGMHRCGGLEWDHA